MKTIITGTPYFGPPMEMVQYIQEYSKMKPLTHIYCPGSKNLIHNAAGIFAHNNFKEYEIFDNLDDVLTEIKAALILVEKENFTKTMKSLIEILERNDIDVSIRRTPPIIVKNKSYFKKISEGSNLFDDFCPQRHHAPQERN